MPTLQLRQLIAGFRDDAGDAFGIEFESEHCAGFMASADRKNLRWLRYHDDGSLRDSGLEFTTSPIRIGDEVDASLKEFCALRDKHGFTFGPRTSTHIHINVGDLNMEEVACMYSLLVALEPTLMRLVTVTRRNNLFCQPITHCPNSVMDIPKLASTNAPRDLNKFPVIKYSAVSTQRLFDYGTFEFRAMEGCAAGKEGLLRVIMSALLMVKNSARILTCVELCDLLLLDYADVERRVFGELLQDITAHQHDHGEIPTPERRCLALARAALLAVKNRGMYDDVQHVQGTIDRVAGQAAPAILPPDMPNVVLNALRALPVGASLFGFQKTSETTYMHHYVDSGSVFSAKYEVPNAKPRDLVTFNIGEA